MKEYPPRATADYMVRNNLTRKKERDPDLKLTKYSIQYVRQTIRQTIKLYDYRMDESDRLFWVRLIVYGNKKKKRVDFNRKKFK